MSEAQNPKPAPFTYCIRAYRIFIITGKGGGRREGGVESGTREKVRGATVHKAGSKIVKIPT
jgi:hypothetical protein